MSDIYWVDTTGVASWNDNVLGITPWGSASGVQDNVATPTNGDNVFFDTNSTTVPLAGPGGGGIALAHFEQVSGNTLDLSPCFSGINIANNGYLGIRGATVADAAILGTGVVVEIHDTATFGAGNTCNGNNILAFTGSSNNACAITGSGQQIYFQSQGLNTGAINMAGSIIFQDNNTFTNNADITATIISIENGNTVIGTGALQATTIFLNNGVVDCPINGNLEIANISTNTNYGRVSANCLLYGGRNYGAVSGTLTAPAFDNGDGTWGYADHALGSFGTLKLTGIPTPTTGGSGGPLGGPEFRF